MLTQADVPAWLLARGFVGPEAILDDDLVVRDASSRNRNFRVETGSGGYLLKQGLGAEAAGTVANEAAVYSRLAQQPGLVPFVPRLHGYDQAEGVLVLELLAGAVDLRSHHLGSGRFSAGPAAALGTALGRLHRQTRRPVGPVPDAAAWVLWTHEPPLAILRDISAAGIELLRVVQTAPGLGEAIEALRQSWRPESLIHGDVKWDNCLLSQPGEPAEQLRLVDWESAASGDPCWDLGSAFSQYLSFWLFSIPVTGVEPPERYPELAAFPLDAMKPAVTACWLAYRDAAGETEQESAARLVRSVAFAGARLVQTAYEAAQMSQTLTSAIVLHLQLAHNILLRPEDAAVRLLGLPLHGGPRP
jgi:aminoglycoside phosphotransferase (APT) family kinase protein